MGGVGRQAGAFLLCMMIYTPVFAGDGTGAVEIIMTAEQIGSWVQEPNFPVWIGKMPSLAASVARCPYAANLFYLRSDFKAWSERFPEAARAVTKAAMRWQNMNEAEKETFFCRNPLLRPKNIAGPARSDGLNPRHRVQ